MYSCRQVAKQLIDEYRAAESPDYPNWGFEEDDTVPGPSAGQAAGGLGAAEERDTGKA